MAITSNASTTWHGGLADGSGTTELGSGSSFELTWKARAEEGGAVTPEELIAGAHASCFSMALSHELGEAGFTPISIPTSARVGFEPGKGITGSILSVVADVADITPERFEEIANAAKAGCPVSQALSGIEITLESAKLQRA